MIEQHHDSLFSRLTPSLLQLRLGELTCQRGAAYVESGLVRNLRLVPGGGILARVQGAKSYVVLSILRLQGEALEIKSRCTCPVQTDCKHIAAALLGLIQAQQDQQPIPWVQPDDPDLQEAQTVGEEPPVCEPDSWDGTAIKPPDRLTETDGDEPAGRERDTLFYLRKG